MNEKRGYLLTGIDKSKEFKKKEKKEKTQNLKRGNNTNLEKKTITLRFFG